MGNLTRDNLQLYNVNLQASSQCRVAFHPGCALRSGVDVVVGPLGRLILRCGFCVEKLGLREQQVDSRNTRSKFVDFLRQLSTFYLFYLLQVSKFDQQDIFAGERVELTSGPTGTVLEVLASNRLKIFDHCYRWCQRHTTVWPLTMEHSVITTTRRK